MPRYTFKLCDDGGGVEDNVGVNLPDGETAYRYACDVASELMNCRELRTRHWRLDVYQDDRKKIFEIPFAKLDPTLDHLTMEHRELVEHNSRLIRSLEDAVYAAKLSGSEARSLVALSRGKPYLATDRGRKVIRDK
jgi:hypothetical protein